MNDDREDPILDACLEEYLGGLHPPDMKARILAEHLARSTAPFPLSQRHQFDSISPTGVPVIKRARRSQRPQHRRWWPLVAAGTTVAAALVVGAVGGLLWKQQQGLRSAPRRIAQQEPMAAPVEVESDLASAPAVSSEPTRVSQPQPTVAPSAPLVAPAEVERASVGAPERLATVEMLEERPSPVSDAEVVRAINELIRAGWDTAGLEPAAALTEAEWCERVHSRLLGRSPTEAERAQFLAHKSPDKRAKLIDSLTRGDLYVEEFAGYWSELWTDVLLASAARPVQRGELAQYLRRSFAQGKPLDDIAFELLTATGGGQPGVQDYLLAHADNRGIHAQTTAHVSRTFLGMSLACAQCHDHPTSPLRQKTFWELNAFLRQLRLEAASGRDWRLVNQDFAGEGTTPQDAEIYYSQRDGLLKAAYPVFVDGSAIPRSGRLSDVDRRAWLAQFVVRSEEFRQAMVNRIWSQLFGRGFTTPVDDLGPHNLPSHPILLSKLAEQFAAHDFDARALIRWIASSEPFGLSSHLMGERSAGERFFACYPTASPAAKPILESLQDAGVLYAKARDSANGLAARVTPRAISDTRELADLDRALSAISGSGVEQSSAATAFGVLIMRSDMTNPKKIEHMFYATVHRAPTPREAVAVEKLLAGREQESPAILQYVWWALANSREAR